MDESSRTKKKKKFSTFTILRNNSQYISDTVFFKRSTKFWYNIVSSFSLMYFILFLEPYGHYFVSKFDSIDTHNHIIRLKENTDIYTDINTFVFRIDMATWCVIVFIMFFGIGFLSEMQRHPDCKFLFFPHYAFIIHTSLNYPQVII